MSVTAVHRVILDGAHDSAKRFSNPRAAQPPDQSANPPADVVQLTSAEQVYQLYIQGQRISQIAARLNLPVSVVDSYLNLSKAG